MNSFDQYTDLDEEKLAELKMFTKVQHELSVGDDGRIILRCTKIILPCKLKSRLVKIIPESHQGIAKTNTPKV